MRSGIAEIYIWRDFESTPALEEKLPQIATIIYY